MQCPVCDRHYAREVDHCPVDGALLVSVDHVGAGRVGTVLGGRYQIDAILGQGGMGTVFSAVQRPIGRRVAVKVLHSDLAKDKTFVTRFHTEAKAASVLVNPNTVTIHDFGQTDDGTLYIAMEHLAGVSMADRLSRGPLTWPQVAAIGAQVCRALAEAHRKGIVHRDLKPENIMLLAADDGSILVKVLDFGIAKMLATPGRTLTGMPVTQVGVIIGTPQYMSPEQAQGKEPSSASDMYALGVILHESLSGAPPFDHPEHIILLGMQIQSSPPPLESPFGEVPGPMRSLVEGLLLKDAARRPGPADQVGAALRQMVGGVTPPAAEILEEVTPRRGTPMPRALAAVPGPSRGKPPPVPRATDIEADDLEELSDVEATRMVHAPAGHEPDRRAVAEGGVHEETALLSVVVEPASPEDVGLRPDQVMPAEALAVLDRDERPEADTESLRPRSSRNVLLLAVLACVVVLAGAATGVLFWAAADSGARSTSAASVAAGGGPSPGPVDVAGAHVLAPPPETDPPPSGLDAGALRPDSGGDPDGAAAGGDGASSASAPPADGGSLDGGSPRAVDAGLEAPIALNSRPGGARVYRGQDYLCTTPCRTSLASGRTIELEFKRRGYRPAARAVLPGRDLDVVVELVRVRKAGPGGRPDVDPFSPWAH